MARTLVSELSNEELQRLMSLIKRRGLRRAEADRARRRRTARRLMALGIDPLDAQIRQVFFFDTPDLGLDKAGLVVRARRTQGKGDDSVVKLRPVVPSELRAACASHRASASRSTRRPAASCARAR